MDRRRFSSLIISLVSLLLDQGNVAGATKVACALTHDGEFTGECTFGCTYTETKIFFKHVVYGIKPNASI